ncbi:outer membrane protein assembly factor BamA [Treponema sp. OMZ 840]|uniref:outer membrane protein assembly factor BamA n=1 Tax=Treponema sp. OMZ 840 TaxID=244313 RepID=UPI003D912E9A
MYGKRGFLTAFCMCVFVILCINLPAQSDNNWYYGKEIRAIKFNGLKFVKNADMTAVTDSFIGEVFSDELYTELLNKIYALEYFEDISPLALPADAEKNEVIIQFTVIERPIVKSLIFKGNRRIRTPELRDAVSVKENDIYISSKVLLDERKLQTLYLESGYTNVKLVSEINTEEDGVNVIFNIDEGRQTVITAIRFQGNAAIGEKNLKKDMKLKAVGLFNKGAFLEAYLELDKQHVLLYYQNKGYMDAAITDVVRETSYNEEKKRDEITLTYVLKEGSQYTFNGITTEGNIIFSTEELTALMRLKKGSVFNQTRFQEGLAAIADLYYENGYTSNTFYPDIKKDNENRLISCIMYITEGKRSHIERITVTGNTKTKDYVILREIPLESGDIFSKRKVETGLRSLYNLGFFSAVIPRIVQGSDESLIDLVINVEEQSTTSVEFGITFSGIAEPGSWPVSVFANWKDANFLGTGKTIGVNITGSNDEQALSFNFNDPWFLNKPLNFNAGINVKHRKMSAPYYNYFPGGVNDKDYMMDYNQLSFGVDFALGKRWVWDFAAFTLTGGFSNTFLRNFYDAKLYTPVDTTVSDRHGKFGIQNTVWTKGSLNARDTLFDPSKGWFVSQQFSWIGLLPKLESEYFLKTDTKGEIYFTLLDKPVSETWNLKFVFAGYTGFTFLVPVPGSDIGQNNMLIIDGMFNGRGWAALADQSSSVRGTAMWSSFAELRMPLAPGVFSLDFFADIIAVKETPQKMFTQLSIDDFFFSFGPGLRFSLPQFPLRLMWGWAFKTNNGAFEWNSTTKYGGKFVLSFNLTNQ